MLFDLDHEDRLNWLADELRHSPVLAPELFDAVIREACTRLPLLKEAGKARRLDQLIEVAAWTDAALALITCELPSWKVRRLFHEDGEWRCSLSRQPYLPLELDETAEASHDVLPLAILGAFVAARRMASAASRANPTTVPRVQPAAGEAVCCDNFA